MKLSDLSKATKEVNITFSDTDTLKVTYKTDFFTPALESKMQDFDTMPLNGMVETLINALVAWDITDDAGNAIAISKTILSELGTKTLYTILNSIIEDAIPNA